MSRELSQAHGHANSSIIKMSMSAGLNSMVSAPLQLIVPSPAGPRAMEQPYTAEPPARGLALEASSTVLVSPGHS